MPLSSDPEARKRQLANLRPDAALKHGAASERLIRERRTELVAELHTEYPNESKRVLTRRLTGWRWRRPGWRTPTSTGS